MKVKFLQLLAGVLVILGAATAQTIQPRTLEERHPLWAGGPMLGHAGLRYASVWVQTKGPATLCLEYQLVGQAVDSSREPWIPSVSLRSGTQCKEVTAGPAYTALFELDQLHEGATYQYRILVQTNPSPEEDVEEDLETLATGTFKTQPHFAHRYPAPDFTLAIGSCAYVNDPAYDRPSVSYGGQYQVFESLASESPDAMIWLGDNVYFREGDWESLLGMIHRYRHHRALPELQRLLTTCPHYAVWDDHDFGPNDATGAWPLKRESLEAFKLFWANPSYGMPEFEGISTAFRLRDVDLFLLDNRYHRSHHALKDSCERRMLGQAQINWLVEALKFSRAPFKLVVCGSQVLNSEAVHETFANYPCEQADLLKRLAEEKIHNLVFLTGDRHHTERTQRTVDGVVFNEITSSPLTSGVHNQAEEENNRYRVPGSLGKTRGYATLRFSGPSKKRSMLIRFHNQDGKIYYESTLNSLQP
ncbi:MAG: alkaline phosphatase family protein [Cytophagia bacterium]|nr:alkaline phosphatase family protein [Cytophagia bacterium]